MDKTKFEKAKELEDKIKKTQEDISDLKHHNTVIALARGEGSMYRELQSMSNEVIKGFLLEELQKRLQDAEEQFDSL